MVYVLDVSEWEKIQYQKRVHGLVETLGRIDLGCGCGRVSRTIHVRSCANAYGVQASRALCSSRFPCLFHFQSRTDGSSQSGTLARSLLQKSLLESSSTINTSLRKKQVTSVSRNNFL